jgi:hypothetical protein
VNSTTCTLNVPTTNLISGLRYTIAVNVTQLVAGAVSQQAQTQVITKQFDAVRRVEELGIDPSTIYVTPTVGLQGTTNFAAGFQFGSMPIFQRQLAGSANLTWQFRVEGSGGLSFSSSQLNFAQSFNVPPTPLNTNVTVNFTFYVTRGADVFIAVRQITATANTQYNILQSPLLQTIAAQNNTADSSSATMLSGNTLSQVGALLQSLGDKGANTTCQIPDSYNPVVGACQPTDANPCCGKGKCVNGGS